MEKHLIFVYGSLKKGYYNHRLMEGTRFIGKGVLSGATLYDMNISFPCILLDGSHNKVIGEIYEVDEIQLKAIDRLEGYREGRGRDNLYNREEVTVTEYGSGERHKCFVYEFNRQPKKDWKIITVW